MWYLVFWLVTGNGAALPVQSPTGWATAKICVSHGGALEENLRLSRDVVFPPLIAYTCEYH